jgi:transmembrane sensor
LLPTDSPSANEIQATAAEWLARRSNGEHCAEDQRAFLVWLNASQANRDAFAKADALWEEMRGLDGVADQQLAEARAFLASSRQQPARRRYALAALALIAASIVWQADWLSYLNDQTYQTAVGQRQSIDLADGSRLELNTNSEARVHYSRHGREVRLTRGQAVFTVVHADSRPFHVYASHGKIRDIGTQFDVRYNDDWVSVAVLDGEVEVTGKPDSPPTPLHRGQQLSYKPSGEVTAVQGIDINTFSAWRERKLVFQGQPLKAVLEELGRYHRASITVTAPKILDTKVSGVFPTDNLPQAMQTIAMVLPIKLTQTGDQSWQIDRH